MVKKKMVKGPMWKCGPGPPATLRRHWAYKAQRLLKMRSTNRQQVGPEEHFRNARKVLVLLIYLFHNCYVLL